MKNTTKDYRVKMNWFVECIAPLDFHELICPTVDSYKEKLKSIYDQATAEHFGKRFESAFSAVQQHDWWETELREKPRVIYDPNNDDTAFIFKLDNNGTTFLVSEHGLLTQPNNTSFFEAKTFYGVSKS